MEILLRTPIAKISDLSIFSNIFAFGLDNMPVSSMDGALIANIFQKAKKVDPPGFFREKEKTLAFSYQRKILKSCQRAAEQHSHCDPLRLLPNKAGGFVTHPDGEI